MRVFFDSSAFIKRYIEETGSEDILSILRSSEQNIISILCLPEILSALNRLRREIKITPSIYQNIKDELDSDLKQLRLIDINYEVILATANCLEKAPLRAADAIHIASAIVSKCDYFISSDIKQINAAKSLGLKVKLIPFKKGKKS